MRKILIYITLLFATSVMAANISWAKDYESGIKLAKAQNKPVLFVVSRDTCKFCVILKDTTFKDETVVKALDRDYISIIAQIDENDYVPKELYAPGLPSIWFLLPDGTPMFQPLMGMVKSKDFLDALAIVKAEFDAPKKENK